MYRNVLQYKAPHYTTNYIFVSMYWVGKYIVVHTNNNCARSSVYVQFRNTNPKFKNL